MLNLNRLFSLFQSFTIHGVETSGLSAKDVVSSFPQFRPESAGSDDQRAKLTIFAINNIFSILACGTAHYQKDLSLSDLSIEDLPFRKGKEVEDKLSQSLVQHGSDKSTGKHYHMVYSSLFEDPSLVESVLEVGLGSNNPHVVSNMGPCGIPGASLRAFRDFFTTAHIYGADIDRQILFQESRISTFYVDQLEENTLHDLDKYLPEKIDLLIDDGLHSPASNLITFFYFSHKVSVGGWIVIEDISSSTKPIWQLVSSLLPKSFRCYWLKDTSDSLFLAHRVE